MCNICFNAYDAIKNNHKKCFLKLKDNRKFSHYIIIDGGGLTLIGYSSLEVKNKDFTLFLLGFDDLKKEVSQLGYTCLFEAMIYGDIYILL